VIPEDAAAWVALRALPGMDGPLYSRLLELVGPPEALVREPVRRLESVRGVSPALAQTIASGGDIPGWRDRLISLAEAGMSVLLWNHEGYPDALRERGPRFPVLFCRGDCRALAQGRWIGVVGNPAEETAALELGLWLGSGLAKAGFGIAGELGKPLAAAAQGGAMESGGSCVAVAQHGLAMNLRGKARVHADALGERGAVCSAVLPDESATAANRRDAMSLVGAMSAGLVLLCPAGDRALMDLADEVTRDGRQVFTARFDSDESGFLELVERGAVPLPPAPGFSLDLLLRELGRQREGARGGQLDLFG
jgi:DNA processing protein